MTEQTKAIFADYNALRSVLESFLQTPQKLSIYQKAANKFFAPRKILANNEIIADYSKTTKLEFRLSWSWWGFFGGAWFFFYRKLYALGFFVLLLSITLSILVFVVDEKYENYLTYSSIILSCFCAVYAKFAVIKRFERLLDSNADLQSSGGVSEWAIYLGIAFSVIVCILSFVASIVIAVIKQLNKMGMDEEFFKDFEFKQFRQIEPQQSIEAFLSLFGIC